MCCLPTGSGKTAIAVFAAWQVLMRGGTVTGDLKQEDDGNESKSLTGRNALAIQSFFL